MSKYSPVMPYGFIDHLKQFYKLTNVSVSPYKLVFSTDDYFIGLVDCSGDKIKVSIDGGNYIEVEALSHLSKKCFDSLKPSEEHEKSLRHTTA